MDKRIDQTTNLPLGTRDSSHMPWVVARIKYDYKNGLPEIKPGAYVKFINPECTSFELTENRAEAHGFINPCLEEIGIYDNVIVFLLPGITSPVRHYFEISLDKQKIEREILEEELKEIREADPNCGDCWVIRNNEIIRN